MVTSIVAEREVQKAPEAVRELFAGTFDAGSILDTNAEVEELRGGLSGCRSRAAEVFGRCAACGDGDGSRHPSGSELEFQASGERGARGRF